MPSTPSTNGRVKGQTKVIILTLPPSMLKRFTSKEEPSSVASSPAPAVIDEPATLQPSLSQENISEAQSTPAPIQDAPSPNGTPKPKSSVNGTSGTNGTNGTKRSTPMPADGMAKPRGKPGPKKKPRLEDGTIDHSTKQAPVATTNHKLGPKANTGFINANLRALDRSGAPCRRWQRNGFQLKSFTGHTWELSSWKGSENSLSNGSDGSNKDVSMPDSSDHKQSESDTVAGSNLGDRPDQMEITTPAASSPPAIATMSSVPVQS